jgi:hypothetical protein
MADPYVTLNQGYVDKDGNAHRKVKMRPPKIMDEVEAEQARKSSKYNQSEVYEQILLVHRCIVDWADIVDVKVEHLQALSRGDLVKLISKMNELDEAEGANQGNPASSSAAG